MKWGALLGISFFAVCIVLFQWPKIKPRQKKEKAALISLTLLGWLLSCLLVWFPEMPGPGQWIDTIYKPLGKLLEK
jgi:uncharacterized membrane protein